MLNLLKSVLGTVATAVIGLAVYMYHVNRIEDAVFLGVISIPFAILSKF